MRMQSLPGPLSWMGPGSRLGTVSKCSRFSRAAGKRKPFRENLHPPKFPAENFFPDVSVYGNSTDNI